MCLDDPPTPESNESICYGSVSTVLLQVYIRFHEFDIVYREGNHSIKSIKDTVTDVGILNIATSDSLRLVQPFSGITLTAVMASSTVKQLMRKSGTKTFVAEISINITGPEHHFVAVGDAFDKAKTYLQHPCFLRAGVKYFNPHYFYRDGVKSDLQHLVGPVLKEPNIMLSSHKVEELLDTCVYKAQTESRHAKVPEAAVAEKKILTPLKSHQEEGVNFILTREDMDISSSVFRDLNGGIIADMMGLGKTLTMLSAIVCSKQENYNSISDHTGLQITNATLIVVTSPQLLEVWATEIAKHLGPNILRVATFHGAGRAKCFQDIVDHDVVLTTYHTLVADYASKKLLQNLAWHRVVLDEAHWIRNTSSQQFKVARNLTALKRWCVTGTPIQNSLQDLRSLLDFLRFRPFSEASFFQTHIIDHLSSSSPDPFRNLRLLLGSILLRRTADLLSLPPSEVKEVRIYMTIEEDKKYEEILETCKKNYEEVINEKSALKKYSILFAATMNLRRLCNHGTFESYETPVSAPYSKGKKRKRRGAASLQGEPMCRYCCGEDADTFDECHECSRSLVGEDAETQSPLTATRAFSSPVSSLITPSGSSSKLSAVVYNIQASPPGQKNLVFTSCRLTMNILEGLLNLHGVPCLQINGSTSFSDRKHILSQFCQDPNQCVLIISIGTGAVGLTLTAASRVHIVEPQWNPSVEEQAIARAVRMGQDRCVTIFKYITRRTVEEKMYRGTGIIPVEADTVTLANNTVILATSKFPAAEL
ncbi:SNF2 family N-terminal domain-containing protein [Whalleya microplaca]|nr:SNF2 family N-terminal domain-containing protein [Whalleya microplaca]